MERTWEGAVLSSTELPCRIFNHLHSGGGSPPHPKPSTPPLEKRGPAENQ